MSSYTSHWVRPYRLSPLPRMRLVCFAHAGGSASFFNSWTEHLPSYIDLLAVQYPGRENRFNEPAATSMSSLARESSQALLKFCDAPIALFGHSLGAVLAYETALRLEQAAVTLRHLFVSAQPAPHMKRAGKLHLGSEEALLEDIYRQGHPGNVLLDGTALRDVFLPIIRSDYEAIETYTRTQPRALNCPVDVLLGDTDTEVTETEGLGWQSTSLYPLTLQRFPGGHFYLIEQRYQTIQYLLSRFKESPLSRKDNNETSR